MNNDDQFAEYIVELLEGLDSVIYRNMFGGCGIFRDSLMFALIADGKLYFKADDVNRPEFEDQGLPAFAYVKSGKEMHLSYYLCPEESLETANAIRPWAESGWKAAVRADEAKPRSQRKRVEAP